MPAQTNETTLPINHLKQTLDRLCGQWEFLAVSELSFKVRFLNTGSVYLVVLAGGKWQAQEEKDFGWAWSEFLESRLNGLKRDDAGNMVRA